MKKLQPYSSEYWIKRNCNNNTFEIGQENTGILKNIKGIIIRKIYYLLLQESRIPKDWSNDVVEKNMSVNCHGAVNWMFNNFNNHPNYNMNGDIPEFITENISLEEALDKFQFPIINQIINQNRIDHSSIILGVDKENEPIVFEKEGCDLPFRIVSWNTSISNTNYLNADYNNFTNIED
jgi:hypothetical protein